MFCRLESGKPESLLGNPVQGKGVRGTPSSRKEERSSEERRELRSGPGGWGSGGHRRQGLGSGAGGASRINDADLWGQRGLKAEASGVEQLRGLR